MTKKLGLGVRSEVSGNPFKYIFGQTSNRARVLDPLHSYAIRAGFARSAEYILIFLAKINIMGN